jgi:glycosyltransferase involved in cell wall biosynthesis
MVCFSRDIFYIQYFNKSKRTSQRFFDMVLVTVAVPVHNGAKTLVRCLDSLSQQTCGSFKVVVFENASTDDTRAIIESFVARDSRFEMRPSSSFLTAEQNFSRAATEGMKGSDFFCFRAADDYSSPNYLEAMLNGLLTNNMCTLAVAPVTYVTPNGNAVIPNRNSIVEFQSESNNRYKGAVFPGSWFYGLYRTSRAETYILSSFKLFPYPWGMDRLIVYKMIADFGVVFVPEATFFCQVESGAESSYKAKSPIDALRRRLKYYSACMDMGLHKNSDGFLDAINSRRHAWKLAGRHTGTRVGQIARLLIGKKIA